MLRSCAVCALAVFGENPSTSWLLSVTSLRFVCRYLALDCTVIGLSKAPVV